MTRKLWINTYWFVVKFSIRNLQLAVQDLNVPILDCEVIELPLNDPTDVAYDDLCTNLKPDYYESRFGSKS